MRESTYGLIERLGCRWSVFCFWFKVGISWSISFNLVIILSNYDSHYSSSLKLDKSYNFTLKYLKSSSLFNYACSSRPPSTFNLDTFPTLFISFLNHLNSLLSWWLWRMCLRRKRHECEPTWRFFFSLVCLFLFHN